MNIEIHLLSQSKPIVYTNIKNAYTKDGLYCLYDEKGMVYKFPLVNIFRIKETY
jgi:hypothetical protein